MVGGGGGGGGGEAELFCHKRDIYICITKENRYDRFAKFILQISCGKKKKRKTLATK